MPVTEKDLQDADNARTAIAAEIAKAETDYQAALSVPEDSFTKAPALKAKVDDLRARSRQTDANYSRIWTTYKQQQAQANKPVDPSKAARADAIAQENAHREYNQLHNGFYGTDKEWQDHIDRTTPKPANAAQVTTANTGAANSAETGRHDAATETQAQVDARIKAMDAAATATNTAAGQVYTYANEQAQNANTRIGESRQAGQSLLTAATTARQQNIEQQKSRADFISGVTNGVFSGIQQLMRAGSNGSQVAVAFARAYLTMANQAYQAAGLDKDIPPVDMETPEMKNLREIAKWTKPADIPPMPSADQIDWRVIKSLAARGFPPPGYNGPIGPEALTLPDDPETISKYSGKSTPAAQAESKQATLYQQARNIDASVKDIRAKLPEQRTPEENAKLAAADATLADLTKQYEQSKGAATPAAASTTATTTSTPAPAAPAPASTTNPNLHPLADPNGTANGKPPHKEGDPNTVTYEDEWHNRFTVAAEDFNKRPGGNDDVTVISRTDQTSPPPPSITPPPQVSTPPTPDPNANPTSQSSDPGEMPRLMMQTSDYGKTNTDSEPMPVNPPTPEQSPDYSMSSGPDPTNWWQNMTPDSQNTDEDNNTTYNWSFLR